MVLVQMASAEALFPLVWLPHSSLVSVSVDLCFVATGLCFVLPAESFGDFSLELVVLCCVVDNVLANVVRFQRKLTTLQVVLDVGLKLKTLIIFIADVGCLRRYGSNVLSVHYRKVDNDRLLVHPDNMGRVEELDRVIGDQNIVEESRLPLLVYLDAAINPHPLKRKP
ncbi:hypothetical protein QUC31_008010 [Theobroma cacao]